MLQAIPTWALLAGLYLLGSLAFALVLGKLLASPDDGEE
jgi:glycerol-3-phosphate acyltransferase PlsY